MGLQQDDGTGRAGVVLDPVLALVRPRDWPLAAASAGLSAIDAILFAGLWSSAPFAALFAAGAGATGALALYLRAMR